MTPNRRQIIKKRLGVEAMRTFAIHGINDGLAITFSQDFGSTLLNYGNNLEHCRSFSLRCRSTVPHYFETSHPKGTRKVPCNKTTHLFLFSRSMNLSSVTSSSMPRQGLITRPEASRSSQASFHSLMLLPFPTFHRTPLSRTLREHQIYCASHS